MTNFLLVLVSSTLISARSSIVSRAPHVAATRGNPLAHPGLQLSSKRAVFGGIRMEKPWGLREGVGGTTRRIGRELVLRPHTSITSPSSQSKAINGFVKTGTLGVLFLGWYAFNIMFNIFNKQVLKQYPFPVSCTALQFAMGTALAGMFWLLRINPIPKFESRKDLNGFLIKLFPVALVHALGNLLTNISLGKVAVSFTHTIKIVIGVSLASFTEASFNWMGLGAAMGSNVFFQSRNVISKVVMGDEKKKVDSVALFSMITIISFLITLPLALTVEPQAFTALAAGEIPGDIIDKALKAAFCFHAYQQVSYAILSRVTPVTHSVGNCVKRVVVIASSILFFRNPVSPLNLAGAGIALSGVAAYSTVKRMSDKWKNEKKEKED
ncbi:hypothetical protein AAMO2058_001279400 [Amorphochlora amoebiformis]